MSRHQATDSTLQHRPVSGIGLVALMGELGPGSGT